MEYYYELEDITEYKGKNIIINNLKNKLLSNPQYQLSQFDIEYVSTNITFKPLKIEKSFNLVNSEQVNQKYNLNNKIYINTIEGETNTYIHITGSKDNTSSKYTHYLIPQKCFVKHPTKDYSDIKLNVNEYIQKDTKKRRPFDYQITGSKHLLKYEKCILGDDKGTGKTYQSILAALHHGKKTLVVTIKATKTNWVEEISCFTTKHALVKNGKDYPNTIRKDFVVINYALLHKQSENLLLDEFDCIILDECQKAVNLTTNVGKSLVKIITNLKPKYVWGLSATPIQNPLDFIALLKYTCHKEVFDHLAIQKFKDYYYEIDNFVKCRQLNIKTELADYTYIKKNKGYLELNKKYNGVYDIKSGGHYPVNQLIKKVFYEYITSKVKYNTESQTSDEVHFSVDIQLGSNKKTYVPNRELSFKDKLTYLNDLFYSKYQDENQNANKATITLNLVVNNFRTSHTVSYSWYTIENIKGIKRLYSFRQNYMKHILLRRLIDDEEVDKEIPPIHFKKHKIKLLPEQLVHYNSLCQDMKIVQQLRHLQYLAEIKVSHTIKLLENVINNGEKFIIGTSFEAELQLFKEYYGDKIHIINGQTSDVKRQKYCKELKDNPKILGVVGNITAMGTGLNMTGANHILQNSGQYNSNKPNQLSGRIRRIGQTLDCYYTNVVVADTEDDNVQRINIKKNKLIDFMLNHKFRN